MGCERAVFGEAIIEEILFEGLIQRDQALMRKAQRMPITLWV